MTRLIVFGILAAFFFSSTFVFNRAMSLEGGHWAWTASLRYGYMLLLLCTWLLLKGRRGVVVAAWDAFRRNWLFWTTAGSVGFGAFYALISFSASFAPGWVVATTWQITILATPVVLLLFGRRVPARGVLFTAMIFLGIVLVTLEQATAAPLGDILRGVVPVVAAAFAYPLGNQMVWEARHGTSSLLPAITDPVVDDSFGRVLLMVLGSIPFWVVLLIVAAPPPPSPGQLVNTALVAVFSGVIATSLFLHARHCASTTYELAAIDATQSTEVIFSLLGEIVFLHGLLPGSSGTAGLVLVVGGLMLYVRAQTAGQLKEKIQDRKSVV